MSTTAAVISPKSRMSVVLWIAQILVAILFCFAGFLKLTSPIPQLAAMIPWTGQSPETFVRILGAVDLAGGIGILLPAATRILPSLTVIAALGCSVLQVFAIAFHSSRGEFGVLPLNFVLLPLAIFVFWGRWKKAPIEGRF
jgi:uncharacterized membrane protein YphA (DoxX/SURF4 family)